MQEYRELKDEEILQEGDEFWSRLFCCWTPTYCAGQQKAIAGWGYKYRRPIKKEEPAAGPEYRDLLPGEIIQAGDEFLDSDDPETWIPRTYLVGMRYMPSKGHCRTRRPIKKEDNWSRLRQGITRRRDRLQTVAHEFQDLGYTSDYARYQKAADELSNVLERMGRLDGSTTSCACSEMVFDEA